MRMKFGENKLELREAVFDLGTMCCDVLLPVFNVNMLVTHLTLSVGLAHLLVCADQSCMLLVFSYAQNSCF